ncbi:UDP-N-acetylmuramoyl-tripeptide--D-alanyl-D-alanine ligase [Thioclava sp. SK-1]|uniref:UDP-N-acetylmuramoyl-tripeptide--D-alanyl-D- alanine ligase n=1 Tax=Thioclava sp. SK-1 TaxID=1889770 RepID=UPI00082558BC|nr:UDP-N-acetylmuramoyl-tripeptide--D-alanyl-D-alanine ligase [Thioclava sp. SK-1]OCX66036.1 UDP-N-acetylmuramoyl-tripeptide--D-alanyl-D-alanine ligase [Thioclava sp. SK-1]
MTALWTSQDMVAATGGRATQDFAVAGLSIDTRSIAVGDMFIALTAARDGHDFVRQALDAGAAGALVSRIPEGCTEADPLIVVPDVLPALEDMARAARSRTRARIVAVTGSVGKTSTKEMLRAVLSRQGTVHAAEASFNNHWGVPLTLARMPKDCDFAVIEIGMNHPGEIAPLARLTRPHVALITTVAAAHLEAFDDLGGIAREKAAIFKGLVPNGVAVVPNDLDVSPILYAAVKGELVSFGTEDGADYQLLDATIQGDVTVVQARMHAAPMLFKLATPGRHFAANALGVLAAVEALGGDPALAALDIAQWHPPAGRGSRERIRLDPVNAEDSFDLFDDAFNANPTSLGVALEVLAAQLPRDGVGRVKVGRRVAILGEMLELGPDEQALHAEIALHPALETVHTVHMVGPRMQALRDALPYEKRGEWVADAAELIPRVRHLVDAGDVVLVKGSKGSKVSTIVTALKKLAQPVVVGLDKDI